MKTPTLSRRNLMRNTALAGMAALAACAVTTTNGVTTITLNVDKVKNYGQAGLNAAKTVINLLSGIPSLAPAMATLSDVEASLASALLSFTIGAGSSITINYNDANWKTRVDSILAGMDTVSGNIANAVLNSGSLIPTDILRDVRIAQSALATVVSLFRGILGVSSASRAQTTMTEAQAIEVLHTMAGRYK